VIFEFCAMGTCASVQHFPVQMFGKQQFANFVKHVNSCQRDNFFIMSIVFFQVFPWFDSNAGKILGSLRSGSLENTPIKSSPMKQPNPLPCLVPVEGLYDRPWEYFYQDTSIQDTRTCLFCKTMGDGAFNETGRLLYVGQNEWVHCNCALWSGEVCE